MEFVLTGDSASGAEFERLGVVTKVFPKSDVVQSATALAEKIAKLSAPVIRTAKQAVLTGMLINYRVGGCGIPVSFNTDPFYSGKLHPWGWDDT
jgi:hypothetical protein